LPRSKIVGPDWKGNTKEEEEKEVISKKEE